ncbi:hypothetical protein I204_05669 [Kwoniella mangroviensis CBS 8886]|nr:hypothetical protein I204_05669 [Kwoniella mangroviensis CBS 8886]
MTKVLGMLRQLEMESVTAFQSEVVPLMSSGDPKIVEELIQSTMEDIGDQNGVRQLEIARQIPLPPSPPPSLSRKLP